MFCPSCGAPLPDGAKFCSKCGAPISETSETPVTSEAPETPELTVTPTPEAPKAPETPELTLTPEPPKTPEAPTTPPPAGPSTPNMDPNTMTLVLRIVCGVLGAVFAFYALRGAYYLIRFITNTMPSLPSMAEWWFGSVPAAVVYALRGLLGNLLGLVASAAAAVILLLGAAKWDPKHNDFVVCGVIAAAALRVIDQLLISILGLLVNILSHNSIFTILPSSNNLLHILGYVLAAAVAFVVMTLMGCPPVLGENVEQIKAKVMASFSELLAGVQKAASDAQAAAAQKKAANAQAATNTQAAPTAGTAPTGAPTRLLNTNRGIIIYILLNIITCGIYSWFFIHGLAKDMNEVCEGDGQKTSGLLTFILLSFITCGIYSLIWWYMLCNRQATNAPRYGLNFQENGTTFLLWTLLGSLLCGIGPLIAIHFVLRNMNALCGAYNQRNGL